MPWDAHETDQLRQPNLKLYITPTSSAQTVIHLLSQRVCKKTRSCPRQRLILGHPWDIECPRLELTVRYAQGCNVT